MKYRILIILTYPQQPNRTQIKPYLPPPLGDNGPGPGSGQNGLSGLWANFRVGGQKAWLGRQKDRGPTSFGGIEHQRGRACLGGGEGCPKQSPGPNPWNSACTRRLWSPPHSRSPIKGSKEPSQKNVGTAFGQKNGNPEKEYLTRCFIFPLITFPVCCGKHRIIIRIITRVINWEGHFILEGGLGVRR